MEIVKTSSKNYERKIKKSSYNKILKIRIIIKRTIPLVIGMFLIICGGIYIFIREKIKDQSIVTEKPLR